jgi:hypothetical protein
MSEELVHVSKHTVGEVVNGDCEYDGKVILYVLKGIRFQVANIQFALKKPSS